ncbi:MAG: aldo/keto reductase [Desulfobacterales bacterium]|nr:aldo/keto reductase [Desulfobacterales bacterium]
MERLFDAGINYIDSAEAYGNEGVIGQVMKKRNRQSVFITTKLVLDKKDLSKEFYHPHSQMPGTTSNRLYRLHDDPQLQKQLKSCHAQGSMRR